MYNEDSTLENFRVIFVTNDGFEREENGNIIDPVEPSASAILELMNAPQLTHRGEGAVWFVEVCYIFRSIV